MPFRRFFYLRRRGTAGAEAELRDELESHVTLAADELVAQGVDPVEARARARARFGRYDDAVAALTADARTREGRMHRRDRLGGLLQDLRFALGQLRRSPAFSATVILTLALGIGATTATFTIVREVLLRELPFAAPDRLVRVWAANPVQDEPRGGLSVPDVDDWRRLSTSLEGFAAYSNLPTGLTLADGGEPVQLRTTYVSPDFFATLGVGAQLGRTPLAEEHRDGDDRVVVVSHALWRSRFGSDPSLVGRTLRLNDEPFTVVGIMPPSMRFPEDPELWTPLTVVPANGIPRVRGVRWLQGIGRLRPDATPERARAELSAIAARLEGEERGALAGWTAATVMPLRDFIQGDVRTRLLVIFGAVVLVLLLGAVNVANLVLVRSSARRRELAIRTALGAGRGRIARQLLTESVLLALVGGVLAVALAWWGASALAGMTSRWMPPMGSMRPDWVVLAFALGLSALIGVAFGLIPATRRRDDAGTTLRESARGTSGGSRAHVVRATLVAAEVALAVTLVAGAGLLVKSFTRLNAVQLGFDADRTLSARVTLPASRYPTSETFLPAAERMLEQVRAIPGVTDAAMVKDAPFSGRAGESSDFAVPGRDAGAKPPTASFLPVSPGYFRTMGIALRQGRDLTAADGDTLTAGVVVSESVARAWWPEGKAVGEQLEVLRRRVRVVGVGADARYVRVDSAAMPMIYLPLGLMRRRIVTFVARTSGDPAALVAGMRAAIRAVNPDQPIAAIEPLRADVSRATAAPRFLTQLVAAFGVLALLLAALGVYGVVTYVVGQRTRDIGIRLALGARARDIATWTLRTGLAPVLAGMALGVVASLVLSRVLRAQLFEVSPTDPGVFASVVAVIALVSLLATAIPAGRATRVDPAETLRRE